MNKQTFLDLTPIDNESHSIYINANAIQAIEKCARGSIVRIKGIAYKVREDQSVIIEMIDAEVKYV